jgi:hypothetical protein
VIPDRDIECALVVVAHPDDIDFWAGGTIACWTSAGIAVAYCVVTDNRWGFGRIRPRGSLLREYLQGREALIYAYGNSAGDRELLEAASIARRVRRYSRPSPCGPLRGSSASATLG